MSNVLSIRALNTRYKQWWCRSRLEARWAMFFDLLGFQIEYEPQGFELPAGFGLEGRERFYLPDFFLRPRYWVEIRPALDSWQHSDLVTAWLQLGALTFASKQPALLILGEPAYEVRRVEGQDEEVTYLLPRYSVMCWPNLTPQIAAMPRSHEEYLKYKMNDALEFFFGDFVSHPDGSVHLVGSMRMDDGSSGLEDELEFGFQLLPPGKRPSVLEASDQAMAARFERLK